MREAVSVDAVRTPLGRGKPGGALAGVRPVDLQATVLRAVVSRTGLDPAAVDDVIGGAVGQIGEHSMNTTRWAVLSGAYDIAIASGVESISRVPIGSQAAGADFLGASVTARHPDGLVPQGISAELIAARRGLARHGGQLVAGERRGGGGADRRARRRTAAGAAAAGPAKVYATARDPLGVDANDPRVVALKRDVTSGADVAAAAAVTAPKVAPDEVARLALDAVEAGDFEVLVDDVTRNVKAGPAADVSALYPQLAS